MLRGRTYKPVNEAARLKTFIKAEPSNVILGSFNLQTVLQHLALKSGIGTCGLGRGFELFLDRRNPFAVQCLINSQSMMSP